MRMRSAEQGTSIPQGAEFIPEPIYTPGALVLVITYMLTLTIT